MGADKMRGVRLDPERLEVRWLLQRAPLRGARVLEIGSGNGRSARRIARYVRTLVGIDPDATAITRAQKLTPTRYRRKLRFEVGNAEDLRFPNGSFDLVLFSLSL